MDKVQKSRSIFQGSAESEVLNPSRLTLARMRQGMTKSALANRIGVDRKSVEAYESGKTGPSEETMARIVSVLGFSQEFFAGDDLDVPSAASGSFRSMSKMKAGQRDMALSQVALCLVLNSWLSKKFDLPKPQLPDLSRITDPEAAAEYVRRDWGLGSLSIRNMIHLLEAKGVRVFSLSVDAREVDAFSLWHGGVPYVFLNTMKTSEHSRFDAAHELGHLAMHKHGPPSGLAAERQADAFASAFLMPRGSVAANALRFPTYDAIVSRKTIWTTSVGAVAYRMHAIGLMTDWQYRGICIEIAKRGKSFEPNEAPREISMVLPKLFSALAEEGLSRTKIAEELTMPVKELEQLVFGLVMTGLEGGRRSANESKPSQPTRLTLVEKN